MCAVRPPALSLVNQNNSTICGSHTTYPTLVSQCPLTPWSYSTPPPRLLTCSLAPSLLQPEFPGAPHFRIDRCGMVVSLHASKYDPFFPNADHLLAVANGGLTTEDNLTAVHWRVNGLKSDRCGAERRAGNLHNGV